MSAPTPLAQADYRRYWEIVTETVKAQQNRRIAEQARDERLPDPMYFLAKEATYEIYAKRALTLGVSQMRYDVEEALRFARLFNPDPDRSEYARGTLEATERLLRILS